MARRDRVHMIYDAQNLNHHTTSLDGAFAVLRTPSLVPAALDLTGEVLFDKRVKITPWSNSWFSETSGPVDLKWGWFANPSSSVMDVKLRYPQTSFVPGIFDSYREGRHVLFMGFPVVPHHKRPDSPLAWIYRVLHTYNVLSVLKGQRYTLSSGDLYFHDVLMASKEHAEEVCRLYDRSVCNGHEIRVVVRRPPMKHLGVSWDRGHNRAHYQPRDEGSAQNTNFASV